MGNVIWAESAAAAFADLPAPARDAVLHAVENIQAFPRMYPVVPSAQLQGCRRVVVDGGCVIHYQVSALSESCYLVAVVDAHRSAP